MEHIARFVVVILTWVIVAGCDSHSKKAAPTQPRCLTADVSVNDESVSVTNKGKLPWKDLAATFFEGGAESNSFKYTFSNDVVQPVATISLALKHFVREDGLRYDPLRYAVRQIMIDTANQGLFVTTDGMTRDARGMFINDCEEPKQ